jgi:hypothetical protein
VASPRRYAVGRRRRRRGQLPDDPSYDLRLEDDEVEQLAKSVCPETVALKCWEMLRWKREAARNRAREWHTAADRKR